MNEDQIAARNKELWTRLFRAEFGRQYYDKLRTKLRNREKNLQLGIAFVSLVGVGFLFLELGNEQIPWSLRAAQFLLALGAVGGFLRPYFKWEQEANDAQIMYMRYTNLYHGWLSDWRVFQSDPESELLITSMEFHHRLQEFVDMYDIPGEDKKLKDELYTELFKENSDKEPEAIKKTE